MDANTHCKIQNSINPSILLNLTIAQLLTKVPTRSLLNVLSPNILTVFTCKHNFLYTHKQKSNINSAVN